MATSPCCHSRIFNALRKADERRVSRREKNHPELRTRAQAAGLRPPFARTQSGYPGGRSKESLPSLFGSTRATRHRKYRLFLPTALFLLCILTVVLNRGG